MKTAFYRQVLKTHLAERCERNAGYSLRAFARALDIDPAALSKVLSGKTVPSSTITQKILDRLDLDAAEQAQFLNSVAADQRSRNLQRLSPFFRQSAGLDVERTNDASGRELSAEHFRVISEWYHFAILELTFTKGFVAEPKWISRTLGISEIEAKMALERLFELELIERRGRRVRKTAAHLTTADKTTTTAAHRRRQKQILTKSIEALESDAIETRSHTGMTMAIDPRKLPAAKKMISDFNRKLSEFLESGERTNVYELSISLFSIQKGK